MIDASSCTLGVARRARRSRGSRCSTRWPGSTTGCSSGSRSRRRLGTVAVHADLRVLAARARRQAGRGRRAARRRGRRARGRRLLRHGRRPGLAAPRAARRGAARRRRPNWPGGGSTPRSPATEPVRSPCSGKRAAVWFARADPGGADAMSRVSVRCSAWPCWQRCWRAARRLGAPAAARRPARRGHRRAPRSRPPRSPPTRCRPGPARPPTATRSSTAATPSAPAASRSPPPTRRSGCRPRRSASTCSTACTATSSARRACRRASSGHRHRLAGQRRRRRGFTITNLGTGGADRRSRSRPPAAARSTPRATSTPPGTPFTGASPDVDRRRARSTPTPT